MLTSRAARLLSSTTSPSSGATSTTNSCLPISSGVKENSTGSVADESATVFFPTGMSRGRPPAVAAGPSSGRAVTTTSADAPSSPDCRSVTTTADRSDFFIIGGAWMSTATSTAAPGPTPTV